MHYFRCMGQSHANAGRGVADRLLSPVLRGVVGVDRYVVAGQVAGPEAAGAVAESEIDVHGKFGLTQVTVRGGLVEGGGPSAAFADEEIAEMDSDSCGIDLRAGVADGSDETASVGVAACPRGLD